MTCSTCKHWNPKQSPAMAKQYFAVCNKGPVWEYMPPTGKCNDHAIATVDVVEKRAAWLEKAK